MSEANSGATITYLVRSWGTSTPRLEYPASITSIRIDFKHNNILYIREFQTTFFFVTLGVWDQMTNLPPTRLSPKALGSAFDDSRMKAFCDLATIS